MFSQMEISDSDKKQWEQVLELDYMSIDDTDGMGKIS